MNASFTVSRPGVIRVIGLPAIARRATAGVICSNSYFALLLLTFLGSGQELPAQDPFTRITSSPVVSGVNSTILAWGDFNNDSFQDLYVSTRTGSSLLYSNNGDGTFSRVLTGPVAADGGSCFGATWGDYDNDGFLDLFVGVNNFGNDWLYHNDRQGGFEKIRTGAIVTSGANANNCSWADYDRDGFLDLFVANSDQNDFFYHNNGNGTFTKITTNVIALKTGNSQGGSWADYDNDGWPDLFVSRVNEPNLLYHNEGQGIFVPITNGIVVHDVSVGQGTSWGDYDNDGFLDLFVVNPRARNFLYRNNGDGSFSKIVSGPVVTDIGDGHGCGWADYDNDGYLDLFVANRLGTNFLYHNNGDATFARVSSVVTSDAADAVSGAWADYDNDGFPDLFVTELNSFNNRFFRNNSNGNNWLTVACSGRRSNRSAIGAQVRVKAVVAGKTLWQLREISGGGGLGSQNDLRAGFGLGDATHVDLVRITWPSGTVQEFPDVAPRQFLTIVEPDAVITPAIWAGQPGEPALFTVTPSSAEPMLLQWKLNGVALTGETNDTLRIAQVQAQDAGAYSVDIDVPSLATRFTPASATLTGPVVITRPPAPQNVRLGSSAVFSVQANGLGPFSYQWRFKGAEIAGAVDNTLTIANCQWTEAGFYEVIVSNPFGTAASAPATLDILVDPIIIMQPLSQSVAQGSSVTLSVAISGNPPPFTYEWRRGSTGIWTNVTSASVSFFTVTNLQPGAPNNYRVAIKNAANFLPGILSSTAALTVLADSDHDGLPDSWETAAGLDPADAADAAKDADGDGLNNFDEYRVGTSPADAHSSLRWEGLSPQAPNHWVLQFWTVSNRTYTVESRLQPDDGMWERLTDVPAAPTNRLIEISLPTEENLSSQFYRLVCPRRP